MGIAQHRGMVHQAHHRAAWAEILGNAQGMAEALLVQAEQARATTDHTDPGERAGGVIFGRGRHQRGTGTQGSLVADAEGAEQFLATDGPALLAPGIGQCQQGRHHCRPGMALGGEVALMGIQAVDAEAPRPGSPQWMDRAPVEEQAAGEPRGRIVLQGVALEGLAGVVVAGSGGNAEDVQQAGLQQFPGAGRRLTETEITDERIERHVDTPQSDSVGLKEWGARYGAPAASVTGTPGPGRRRRGKPGARHRTAGGAPRPTPWHGAECRQASSRLAASSGSARSHRRW
ncbi:hypothetical protein D9M72_356500 [compost metagenome]